MRRLAIVFLCVFCYLACFAANPQIDSLKQVIAATQSDSVKVEVLIELSKVYLEESPKEAIVIATQAKDLAQKINYRKGEAYALKNIGNAHYFQGHYADAFLMYKQSLAVFESMGDTVGVSNINNNIGVVFFEEGDYETALEYYFKSLKGAEEANDTLRIVTACVNVGETYSHKPHTYNQAVEYYERALHLSEASGDSESVGMATLNLGELYYHKNNDSLALNYLHRSLNAFPDSLNITGALNYTGMVYRRMKEYPKAISYHQHALDLAKRLDFKLEMVQSLYGIAETQRQSGAIVASINTFKQAEEIANKSDTVTWDLKDIYEGMALAYSAEKDFTNAFKYQRSLDAVKASLYDIDVDKKLQGVQFKFDIQKKENDIKLLTKDKEIQKQEIVHTKLIRNGFMGGFALMLLFATVFLIQRNRISKEKKRSDELLLNILPEETAEELKATGAAKAKSFDSVTVLFTDFKNFTQASEKLGAEELVKEINYCFSAFDKIVTKYKIEKIKTIGDAYMCAGGLPVANQTHADDVVKAGLEMQQFIESNKRERIAKEEPYFELRLGIHTGPVVAGIVGIKKFAYDIWGDTVNLASRMESSGEVGKVNISESTYQIVKGKFNCVHRGKVQAKNKGEIDMYFVEGAVNS